MNLPENPCYPDQTIEDFAYFYDADTSAIPWFINDNCGVCSRVYDRMNPKLRVNLRYHIGDVQFHQTLCSPQCEQIFREAHNGHF